MSNLVSNVKWAWQATFLRHNPVTLENYMSFQDVQMILVPYSKIPHRDRLAKNVKSRCVQIILRSMANPYYDKLVDLQPRESKLRTKDNAQAHKSSSEFEIAALL